MTYPDKISDLKCVIIIPTYNNAGTIAQVIADVKIYSHNIIVVNDGSTDNTTNIISNITDIHIISYTKNKGKGYALRTGLAKAYELGYEYAITIDSDGQHFADDIPLFIHRIIEKPGSLLIGARNLEADNMPSKNSFANRFSNFWYKVETGHTLADTQSGFRLYPLKPLHNIKLITRRYEFEVEIIVRAAWRGINVENIPIKIFYAPQGQRITHFRPLQDFTRISILNTILVLCALLFYYPWRFTKALTRNNIKKFISNNITNSADSNLRLSAAIGWGMFCGIIPIWGYQMIFAIFSAHILKLNKLITIAFSNISIPPMIPFILYGSMVLGAWILRIDNTFSFHNITLETIGLGLWQYIVGSIALASIVAILGATISFCIMSICNRNK